MILKAGVNQVDSKKATKDLLVAQDLDTKEDLVLVTEYDVAKLELTLGQHKSLAKMISELKKDSKSGPAAAVLLQSDPVTCTTKSLAKNGDLDEILKKIEGNGSIDDPLC